MAGRKSIKALPREDLPDPPVDWVWVNLADLAADTPNAIVDGPFGSNLKTSHYTESGPRVVRLQNIGDGHFEDERAHISIDHFNDLERHHVQPDDLLIAALGEELPRACLVPQWLGPALVKADCPRIRLNDKISIPEFVCHWLNSRQCRDRAAAIIHGVGRPRMNLAEIRGLWVPIAHPLEQAAIAAKVEALFSELDAGVAQLEAAQALLKRYRQSVLRAAFEGRLTAEWREQRRREAEAGGEELPTAEDLLKQIEAERQERAEQQHAEWRQAVEAWEAAGGKDSGEKKPRRPARPKDPPPLTEEELESLPELPEGWAWTRADMLVAADRPICYGILMPKGNVEDGVLYVKVRDMRGDRINVDALQRTAPEIAKQYDRASLVEGDVLLAIRGTYGRVALVPPALEGGNITQDSARLTITPLVNRDFCAWALRAPECQNFFKRVARGVAGKGGNIGDVRLCPMPLCSDEEQAEIVREVESRLSVIDDIENTTLTALTEAKALRQSILKRAFEGRLLDEAELEAVRSHPDYEPADRLLERIRERAAAQSKTKKQTKKKTTRTTRSARKNTGTPQETT